MEKFSLDCCFCAFEEYDKKKGGLYCNYFKELISFSKAYNSFEKGEKAFRNNNDCEGFTLLEDMSEGFERRNGGRKWTGSSSPIELDES